MHMAVCDPCVPQEQVGPAGPQLGCAGLLSRAVVPTMLKRYAQGATLDDHRCHCAAPPPRRQLFKFTPANPGRQYPKKLVPLEEWLQKMKKVHEGTDTYIEASALELEDPPGTQGIWD